MHEAKDVGLMAGNVKSGKGPPALPLSALNGLSLSILPITRMDTSLRTLRTLLYRSDVRNSAHTTKQSANSETRFCVALTVVYALSRQFFFSTG